MSDFAAVFHRPTLEALPFWEGCESGQFLIQTCRDCAHTVYPARLFCTNCGSEHLDWIDGGSSGTIYSFTHVFVPFGEVWKAQVPYTSVLIDLDAGVRVVSRLIGAKREDVRVGDRVHIAFTPVCGKRLPFFELA